MKGQISIPAQTIKEAVGFILITVSLVLCLVSFYQYHVTYQSKTDLRQAIDYAENFISSECIAYEENGVFYKGILDKSKLDKSLNSCIQTDKSVSVGIIDQKNKQWGSFKQSFKEKISYPVVIKYPNEFVAARMEVAINA